MSLPPPTLTFLGAVGTVTGSRYLLEVSGRRYLIECGLFQGPEAVEQRNWEPFPVDARSLNAVVLSHAHVDHSGYLPRLTALGLQAPVFCTEGMALLLGLLLPDAARIQEEDARFATAHADRKGIGPTDPLYTEEDAGRALARLRPTAAAAWVAIDDLVSLRFRRAGDAWVDIAYPLPLFESGSPPQLLSSVARNVFGMNDVAGLRLELVVTLLISVVGGTSAGAHRSGSEPPGDAAYGCSRSGVCMLATTQSLHSVAWSPVGGDQPRRNVRKDGHMHEPATAVVALGGNALLKRGQALEAASQARAARDAARILGAASERYRLVVTHGNGPQVGLLALMSDAYPEVDPYPLDVLGSETVGQIGYVLEMELDNFIDHQDTVALITRVLVDPDDPAFATPSKFIGPVYAEAEARELAEKRRWTVKPDGDHWRRVVPSPEPQRIVQLGAIRTLLESGFLVVCAGGGGVPVVEDASGHRGVEAVIDKDYTAALLASQLGADLLVLATDVNAVYADFGTPEQRALLRATPDGLRAGRYPAGSMGPKVEAACRFVETTGGRAVIGSLAQVSEMLDGGAGTQVSPDGPSVEYAEPTTPAQRKASE
jgi:carbamate kinase